MTGTHATRATRALAKIAEDDPALAALSLWCRHRDTDETDALASCDGQTIFYGPRFEGLSLAEQIGTAAHQILHVALRHPARSEALSARFGARYSADVYNIAADAVVNEILLQAGFVLPRPFLTLEGVLSEEMGAANSQPILADWDADRLYVNLMARADKGSGGGQLHAYALGRGYEPDLLKNPAHSKNDEAATDWQNHLSRALEAGRAAGRGIGVLGSRFAEIANPQTPWEVVLRGLLTRAVTHLPRHTFSRPSRQWLAMESASQDGPTPAYLPGVARNRRIARIIVGIDVSTSIDAVRRDLFAAQVVGIGQRTGAEVHVLVFDEVVQSERRMSGINWASEITSILLADGGGTSFEDVIARAAALDPSAIVILTDLDGPFGPAPERPVIWAVPDPTDRQPPFGRVVSLAR